MKKFLLMFSTILMLTVCLCVPSFAFTIDGDMVYFEEVSGCDCGSTVANGGQMLYPETDGLHYVYCFSCGSRFPAADLIATGLNMTSAPVKNVEGLISPHSFDGCAYADSGCNSDLMNVDVLPRFFAAFYCPHIVTNDITFYLFDGQHYAMCQQCSYVRPVFDVLAAYSGEPFPDTGHVDDCNACGLFQSLLGFSANIVHCPSSPTDFLSAPTDCGHYWAYSVDSVSSTAVEFCLECGEVNRSFGLEAPFTAFEWAAVNYGAGSPVVLDGDYYPVCLCEDSLLGLYITPDGSHVSYCPECHWDSDNDLMAHLMNDGVDRSHKEVGCVICENAIKGGVSISTGKPFFMYLPTITSGVDSASSWVSTFANIIMSTPILLISAILAFVGFGIGIFKRLRT